MSDDNDKGPECTICKGPRMTRFKVTFHSGAGMQAFIVPAVGKIDAIHKAWIARVPGSLAYASESELYRIDVEETY